jgi:hypothetical protein
VRFDVTRWLFVVSGRFMRLAAPLGFFSAQTFPGQASRHPLAELQRDVVVERTGVRLLVHDAQFRQHVQNDTRLDFEFSSQLVNANFTHT